MKTIKMKNMGCNVPKNYTGIVEFPNGTKMWWLNDKLHRVDGPAVEYHDGRKQWYLDGEFHREVGPCTTCKDCRKGNFELCSKPGPAVEYPNGLKEWYLNDKLHRTDGPAVIWPSGSKEYWLNDKRLDEQKINQFVKEFGYPIEVAIKLVCWLETNKP